MCLYSAVALSHSVHPTQQHVELLLSDALVICRTLTLVFHNLPLSFLQICFVEQSNLSNSWKFDVPFSANSVNLQRFVIRHVNTSAAPFVVIFQRVTSWSSQRRLTTAGSRWCAA